MDMEEWLANLDRSVKYAAQGNRGAMERSRSASFVLNWALNAYTESQESSWMPGTSSSSSG